MEVYVSGHLLNSTPYHVDVSNPQLVKISRNQSSSVSQEAALDGRLRGVTGVFTPKILVGSQIFKNIGEPTIY